MRTKPDPTRADVVSRRLQLLRAEIARDWREPAAHDAVVADGEAVDGADAVPEAVGDAWWAGHTRVAAPVPDALIEAVPEAVPDPVIDPGSAPAVPVPGRHAARRAVAARLIPEQVRGRVALGPWHLAVVALGVAVALAVACWWVVRGSSTSVPAPAPVTAAPLVALTPAAGTTPAADPSTPVTAVSGSAAIGSTATATASPSTADVTVDVEGKVRRPGVRVLPAGSRVIDAIRAAGGAPRRRDLRSLNLAAVLADGQQIVVGPAAAPGAASGAAPGVAAPGDGSATGSAGPVAPVDLNTATAEQLDTLPDVGPVTAQAILQWRAQNGGFTSVDELMSVDGIGPKTYAEIEPFVTV